jgi:hypothetical protein|nr:MAG TPA: Protein of unknown function (DUF1441) [Caudoviricetes sp.]
MDKKTAVVENGAVYVLQAGTPIYVKTADVCAILGKSNQWVGQLTSQGTLNKSKTAHGALYNLSESLSAYIKSIEDKSSDNPEQKEIELNKLKADVSLRTSKAIVAGLNAKELQGKMHRSEDVAAVTEDLVYTIRSALLALVGRLSTDLVGITDQAELSAKIQDEVYAVMETLSTYKYDSKKYEERVRQRLRKDSLEADEDESEQA